jgi:GntR family transcriptional regulator, rspAB operon transcriptional repressor
MAEDLSNKIKKIRSRGPLATIAYDLIKDAIIHGRFAPGTWLQEEQLTQALGISRTPVREAFNRLKSEGILDVIPRKGAHIVELSPSEIDDLFEAREVIETQFFIRSAKSISKDLILKFKENLNRQETEMRKSEADSDIWNESRKKYLKTDRALHDALLSSAGNTYWEGLYFNLRDRIEMYGSQLSFDREWFDVAIQDHDNIIDAILNQDFEKGKQALIQHIRNVRQGTARIRAVQHPY